MLLYFVYNWLLKFLYFFYHFSENEWPGRVSVTGPVFDPVFSFDIACLSWRCFYRVPSRQTNIHGFGFCSVPVTALLVYLFQASKRFEFPDRYLLIGYCYQAVVQVLFQNIQRPGRVGSRVKTPGWPGSISTLAETIWPPWTESCVVYSWRRRAWRRYDCSQLISYWHHAVVPASRLTDWWMRTSGRVSLLWLLLLAASAHTTCSLDSRRRREDIGDVDRKPPAKGMETCFQKT